MRPVALIIRDGWGLNGRRKGNAVAAAATPNVDRYKRKYPWTRLKCSGKAVGLPPKFQGSSEVGHLTMGAGRYVMQEATRIRNLLRDGELFRLPRWRHLVDRWKQHGGRLHLLGLLQDEGVHAYQDYLFEIMRQARREFPEGEIILHPFFDGRDTPPRSARKYVKGLREEMAKVGRCRIGTVMGRYYGMDRGKQWNLTDQAYHAIVCAAGRKADSAEAAIEECYVQDLTPDGDEMFDEYVWPYCLDGYDGARSGDCVFHTNYRQDRAKQLSMAFVDREYPGKLDARPDLTYLGFTRYWDQFHENLLEPMNEREGMENLLGEVISRAGLRQLRIAETQKFFHVTSFLNGKLTDPYDKEDRVEVPGRFDPATFASHPEMEAYHVTSELLQRLRDNPYQFIVVNYANGDMVGHTGKMPAATRAIEVVDECVKPIVDRLLELDAHVLITADHGNSEEMIYYEDGSRRTSHTLNPVELIYAANDSPGVKLRPHGTLQNVAPMVLSLLDLEIPKEMTGKNLIVG